MNETVIEKLRYENIPNIVVELKPDFDTLINHKNNGEREIKEVIFDSVRQKKMANESALIIINAIGMLLPTCEYSDSKIVGIQMLERFGCMLSPEFRLQYVYPYL